MGMLELEHTPAGCKHLSIQYTTGVASIPNTGVAKHPQYTLEKMLASPTLLNSIPNILPWGIDPKPAKLLVCPAWIAIPKYQLIAESIQNTFYIPIVT